MYSDMSMRTIASSSPNRNSASVRASSVFPTPDGPRKMNEPVGRLGSLSPARERRIALETTSIAGCWPMTRLWSSSSMRMSFCVSASVSLNTGMPVHIETMSAISSSPMAGRSCSPSPRSHCSSSSRFLFVSLRSWSRRLAAFSNSCASIAASLARPDEIVQLVDEQDDVAALGDLLHHLLQALLELAAVLRAGDEGREVQRVDLLALEQLGDVGVGDALGEAFDHCGLAHARLADEHGVVLGAAREDLHDPLDLGLAADHRVELAVRGQLGQVAAELVEQLGRLLLALRAAGGRARARLSAALAAPAGAGQHADDLVADLLRVG